VIGKTIAHIVPGNAARITRTVTEADVASFVAAVGDHNPVHSDPVFAATTVFKEPIAPGIFTAGWSRPLSAPSSQVQGPSTCHRTSRS
jgi:acyl dehydratase